jgi:hypothetical protein
MLRSHRRILTLNLVSSWLQPVTARPIMADVTGCHDVPVHLTPRVSDGYLKRALAEVRDVIKSIILAFRIYIK